jgi:hypothetical protein
MAARRCVINSLGASRKRSACGIDHHNVLGLHFTP